VPSPTVECEVNTCTHWLPGNLCSAGNIDILHEEEGRMAESKEHTQCKTFAHRRGLANMLGSLDNVNWAGMLTGVFRDGVQITPSVTCIVDTCKYWADGDLCVADQIFVSGNEATECQSTNCDTFANRSQA
jgi:hypothetical protein